MNFTKKLRSWALERKFGRTVLFFTGVLLLTMCSFSLPQPGPPFSEDVDSSLGAVLHFASEHRLQFGQDLVFTYGPLGFLTFFYYFPHAFAGQLATHFVLGFVAAAGVCLIAMRSPKIWRWLLLLTFCWVGANGSPRVDLSLNLGLFCWCLLCFVETGNRLAISALVFVVLGVFAALTKISFLFAGVVGVLLLTIDFAIRGFKIASVSILAGSVVMFLLGWILAGQSLGHIGAFLSSSLTAAKGYNETMGLGGAESVRVQGFIWAGLSIGLLICWVGNAFHGQTARVRWRLLLMGSWIFFFLFMIWKYGFVRLDRFHLLVALAFAPVAPLAVQVVPIGSGWTRNIFYAFALACWLVPMVTLKALFLPGWWASLKRPVDSFAEHARAMVSPSEYRNGLDRLLQQNRQAAQLPRCRDIIGSAGVDVFGQDCGYAIFNDFNYQPRPVFQSYFAANKRLQSLNEDFYRSPRSPEFVLFGYGPLDLKFPPLPDAPALALILSNYEPVAREKHFLLLRKKSSAPTRLTLLAQGTVKPRERIDLRSFGDANVWLEIEVRPSFVGRLRQWFYRPPQFRIAVWDSLNSKLIVRNRSPAPMLGAGFVASPLLLNVDNVRSLYEGRGTIHPGAYSVEIPPAEEYLSQQRIAWRVYRIENELGHALK